MTQEASRVKSESKHKKAAIWTFFKSVKPSQAMCMECQNIIKFRSGNLSALEMHLAIHNELFEEFKSMVKNMSEETVQKSHPKRRSLGWNFFRKSNDSTAICSICGTVIKTEGSNTTGILRHLKRCHEDICSEHVDFNLEDAADINKIPPAPTSIFNLGRDLQPQTIWRFFQRQRQHFASCNHCETDIRFYNGDISSLEKHMTSMHPELWEETLSHKDTNNVMENINFENLQESVYDLGESFVQQRNLVGNLFRKDGSSFTCTICNIVRLTF